MGPSMKWLELGPNEEERVIELPDNLKNAISENEDAMKFYKSLSYSSKKKYYQWITSAKKQETREKRIREAVLKLKSNVKL